MWKKLFNKAESVDENATVRVIGDRACGKTSYMASLAYWPNADPNSGVQAIIPIGEEAETLVANAQNILEQGLELEPTVLNSNVDQVKDYTLSITLKSQVKLTINCKDYAGEFFSDLLHKSGDPLLDDYLDDCLQASGILFLVDGTSHRKDSEYAKGLDKFLLALDRADLETSTNKKNKKRIVLVLTKCEQSELWINRNQPKQMIAARFPQLYQKFQNWKELGTGEVEYFTASAFGILGSKFPEPNSQKISRDRGGTRSVIKNPRRWRPFGLVTPIYWLCTGKKDQTLD